MSNETNRKSELDRIINIVEKLAGLDAKFDAFITEVLKDRELSKEDLKEILGRLTLLEKEGTVITREALATQHKILEKLINDFLELQECNRKLEDKYIRLKWVIGSVTLIIVPIISGIVAYAIHELLRL